MAITNPTAHAISIGRKCPFGKASRESAVEPATLSSTVVGLPLIAFVWKRVPVRGDGVFEAGRHAMDLSRL